MADTGLVSVQLDLSSIPYSQAGDFIFTTKGDPVVCTLVSIPLYLAQQIDSLIRSINT